MMSNINDVDYNIKSSQLKGLEMSDNNTETLSNILSTLNNYFYNETKIPPEDLKAIYPYLLLNTMSYEKIKENYSLAVTPKLLEEHEYLYNKDSFELGYVYNGLGYNNKKQFIYCLANQSQYEKEFGKVEDYNSMLVWFSPLSDNNNSNEEIRRYDIVGLFGIRMEKEKKKSNFPFNTLERALIILNQ
jgi:hypothetical protein